MLFPSCYQTESSRVLDHDASRHSCDLRARETDGSRAMFGKEVMIREYLGLGLKILFLERVSIWCYVGAKDVVGVGTLDASGRRMELGRLLGEVGGG